MSDLRVISAQLDLYREPGADEPVLARLAAGTEVAQLAAPDALGWAKLKRLSDGLVGWAFVYYLGPAPVPAGWQRVYEVSASALELRAGPGLGYRVLATMPHRTLVSERIAPSNGWAEVSRQDTGQVGWAYVEYLVPAPTPATAAQPPAEPRSTGQASATDPGRSPAPAGTPSAVPSTEPAPPSAASPSAAPAPATSRSGLCYRPSQQVLDSGGTPLVFDVSHFQGQVDARSAYADGLRGLLHKATEGTGFVDPMYAPNRGNAKAAGLLWGAYHFGIGGDPEGQAQFFLEHAKPDGQTLLALDLESNPQGASMTLDEARAFVTFLHEHTGKWPGVYGGSYLRELLGGARDAVLGNCWFWLADYTDTVRGVPPTWDYWTLWQYTDGNVGPAPHAVAGVPGGRCDRDRFVGDAAELVAFWTSCGV